MGNRNPKKPTRASDFGFYLHEIGVCHAYLLCALSTRFCRQELKVNLPQNPLPFQELIPAPFIQATASLVFEKTKKETGHPPFITGQPLLKRYVQLCRTVVQTGEGFASLKQNIGRDIDNLFLNYFGYSVKINLEPVFQLIHGYLKSVRVYYNGGEAPTILKVKVEERHVNYPPLSPGEHAIIGAENLPINDFLNEFNKEQNRLCARIYEIMKKIGKRLNPYIAPYINDNKAAKAMRKGTAAMSVADDCLDFHCLYLLTQSLIHDCERICMPGTARHIDKLIGEEKIIGSADIRRMLQ